VRSVGPYDIEGEIGRGAMGRVFRARHRPTGAVRALKLLEGRVDATRLERLKREAEALARMGGAGVVAIHEAGMEPGHLYLAMDLMAGGSLRDRLGRRGKLPWREAVTLVAELAAIVERCHALGLIHRDLKPENILFDEEERPHVADFGVVRDLAAETLTVSGQVVGTAAYMAPEQWTGSHVDARADVYALGVTLYETLTGELPHRGENMLEVLDAAVTAKRRPASDDAGSPRVLDRVLDRALAADVADRHESASTLRRDLEAVLAGGPVASAGKPVVRLVAAAVLVVAVAAGSVAAALHASAPVAPRGPEVVAPRAPHAVPSALDQALLDLRHGQAEHRAAIRAALRGGAGGRAKVYADALDAVDRLAARANELVWIHSIADDKDERIADLASLASEILRPISRAEDRGDSMRVVVAPLVPVMRDVFFARRVGTNLRFHLTISNAVATAIAPLDRADLPARLSACLSAADLAGHLKRDPTALAKLDDYVRALSTGREADPLLALTILADTFQRGPPVAERVASVEARVAEAEALLPRVPESANPTERQCTATARSVILITRALLLEAKGGIQLAGDARAQDAILALFVEGAAVARSSDVSTDDAVRLTLTRLLAWDRCQESNRWAPDPPAGVRAVALAVDAVRAAHARDFARAKALIEQAQAEDSTLDRGSVSFAADRVAALTR
jgi:hypothetical protein